MSKTAPHQKQGPECWPEGWLPLRWAFYQFGRAAVGPDWGFAIGTHEIEAAIISGQLGPHLEVDRLQPSKIGVTVSGEEAARLLARPVCAAFASAARSGTVRTAYCRKGAGEPQPMPPGAWRTDDPFLRFRGWSFDPSDEGATGPYLPCWVYVDADDLSALCMTAEEWRDALPHYNGDAKPEYSGEGLPQYYGDALPDEGENYLCGVPVRLVPCGGTVHIWPPSLLRFSPVLSAVEAPPEDEPLSKHGGRPKPKWYSALRTMFEDEEKRHAEWPNKFSSLPPRFITAAEYQRRLVEEKKFPPEMVAYSKVTYHMRALKSEFGR